MTSMSDLLYVLLAMAVLMMPLGLAWFVLSRTARRHSRGERKPGR